MDTDLEFLRELFKDSRLHVGIGTIKQLGLAIDSSVMRVMVNLLPENRKVVATMGWSEMYGVEFPELDDLVIVAFPDGSPDDCFVIKYVSTKDEKIPEFARTGHNVKYSRPGKKIYVGSDTKVGIGRPNIEPTEPLVLGNVLMDFMTAFLNAFTQPAEVGACAVGPVFLDPAVRLALEAARLQFITTPTTNVVSQIAFTERGSPL